LQIEGRTADELEHIASRGLLFSRFIQLAGKSRNYFLSGRDAGMAAFLRRVSPLHCLAGSRFD
jgi:hypothetical protein